MSLCQSASVPNLGPGGGLLVGTVSWIPLNYQAFFIKVESQVHSSRYYKSEQAAQLRKLEWLTCLFENFNSVFIGSIS